MRNTRLIPAVRNRHVLGMGDSPNHNFLARYATRNNRGGNSIPLWGYVPIFAFLAVIGGAYLKLRPVQKSPKIIATSPAVEKPAVVTAPPPTAIPDPPKEPPSPAEGFLLIHPKDGDDDAVNVSREIATLALREILWISDFKRLADMAKDIRGVGWDGLFLALFGRPDSEKVLHEPNEFLPSRIHAFRYFIYYDRVVNPTTGKPEDLFVEFIDGNFRRVLTRSGHEMSVLYY